MSLTSWKKQIIFSTALCVMALFGSQLHPSVVEAATLFASSPTTQVKSGDSFDVTVRVDSQGQSFNAAQATVQFPKDLLQIKSVDFTSAASAFNFWVEEPTFSNTAGTLNFIGGATNGLNGAAIPLLKITFVSKNSGNAVVSLNDGAITAADGSGTNILSSVQPVRIMVLTTVLGAAQPSSVTTTTTTPVATPAAPVISLGPPPPPVEIVRKAEIVSNLPSKPILNVPIYPDTSQWYNITTNFLVNWNLPADVAQVATAVSKDNNTTPQPSTSEKLFDSKIFGALSDGTWYVHVRFKNNVGWGPTAHYRIAIDTVPPLSFKVDSSDGFKTDAPQPTLSFKTSDGQSGISHYSIQIDNNAPIAQEGTSRTLPLQKPGKHTIIIKAVDKAGNDTEQIVDLETVPLPSPIISRVQTEVFVGEGNLILNGTALPDSMVILAVKNSRGAMADLIEVPVDSKGSWQGTLDHPLTKGVYTISATTKDGRGALSLPVSSAPITVRERPLLVIGSLEITWVWVYTISIILLLGALGWGVWIVRNWLLGARKRAVIAQRDVANIFASTRSDIDKLLANLSDNKLTERKTSEITFVLNRLKQNLEKMEHYIVENIEEISE